MLHLSQFILFLAYLVTMTTAIVVGAMTSAPKPHEIRSVALVIGIAVSVFLLSLGLLLQVSSSLGK
jgi:hypothetical protein